MIQNRDLKVTAQPQRVASAAAKVILIGEHAVVYGYPAIAIPVSDLRAYATVEQNPEGVRGLHIAADDLGQIIPVQVNAKDVQNSLELVARQVLQTASAPAPDVTIHLRSDIPIASGMGSGAAVSTAVARALLTTLNTTLSPESLNAMIFAGERVYHGTPSGIDNTVIVYEQPMFFVKDQPIETLDIGATFHLLIGDTGVSASTKVAVGDVRRLYEADAAATTREFEALAELTRQARGDLRDGDAVELGKVMSVAHSHLQALTVSSPELDKMVYAAQAAGAFGAKLSGGGRGGNMIALVAAENTPAVEHALFAAGAARVFTTSLVPTVQT